MSTHHQLRKLRIKLIFIWNRLSWGQRLQIDHASILNNLVGDFWRFVTLKAAAPAGRSSAHWHLGQLHVTSIDCQ